MNDYAYPARFMKRIVLLLPFVLLNPACADPLKGSVQQENVTPISGDIWNENESELLPAGVGFSDKVDAVEPGIKPHKLFSSVTMPAEDKDDTWYQIPNWRAGFFHREKQIDHTQFGDREQVSKVDHLYGMQKDKRGGIWHHQSWPKITKLSLEDGHSQYKIINKYELVSKSDNDYCVKISSTNVDVDDKTGKIIRTGKQEEFDRYFPDGTGKARGYCLIKGYSSSGNVNTQIEKCSVEEEQMKPFETLNTFRGKDLRASFKTYLISHDKADLVPDN
jgi:hypothetical protein